MVANIDLAPTFMDLAADSFAPGADGISMRAILRPEDHVKRPVRDTILVEHVGEYQETIPECPKFNGQDMAVRCIWFLFFSYSYFRHHTSLHVLCLELE